MGKRELDVIPVTRITVSYRLNDTPSATVFTPAGGFWNCTWAEALPLACYPRGRLALDIARSAVDVSAKRKKADLGFCTRTGDGQRDLTHRAQKPKSALFSSTPSHQREQFYTTIDCGQIISATQQTKQPRHRAPARSGRRRYPCLARSRRMVSACTILLSVS